jgi:hypothetical protein
MRGASRSPEADGLQLFEDVEPRGKAGRKSAPARLLIAPPEADDLLEGALVSQYEKELSGYVVLRMTGHLEVTIG